MQPAALPTSAILDAADAAAAGRGELDEPLTERMAYTVPRPLKVRINGLLRWATDDPKALPGVTSQITLARIATHRYLLELERQHNDGQPFPDAEHNNRGRGTTNAEPVVRISIVWPASLHRRLLAAAAWAAQTRELPGITSANKLVAAALDRYISDIEMTRRGGKVFRHSGSRLPAGRLSAR